jgi:hypothetical protein
LNSSSGKNYRETAITQLQRNPDDRTRKEKKDPCLHVKPLQLLRSATLLSGRLLGQKVLVDVGQDTTLSDSNVTKKFVQFLIVAWDEKSAT